MNTVFINFIIPSLVCVSQTNKQTLTNYLIAMNYWTLHSQYRMPQSLLICLTGLGAFVPVKALEFPLYFPLQLNYNKAFKVGTSYSIFFYNSMPPIDNKVWKANFSTKVTGKVTKSYLRNDCNKIPPPPSPRNGQYTASCVSHFLSFNFQ